MVSNKSSAGRRFLIDFILFATILFVLSLQSSQVGWGYALISACVSGFLVASFNLLYLTQHWRLHERFIMRGVAVGTALGFLAACVPFLYHPFAPQLRSNPYILIASVIIPAFCGLLVFTAMGLYFLFKDRGLNENAS